MERRNFVKNTALVALGAVLIRPLEVLAEKKQLI
jgi:hypothetical protein